VTFWKVLDRGKNILMRRRLERLWGGGEEGCERFEGREGEEGWEKGGRLLGGE